MVKARLKFFAFCEAREILPKTSLLSLKVSTEAWAATTRPQRSRPGNGGVALSRRLHAGFSELVVNWVEGDGRNTDNELVYSKRRGCWDGTGDHVNGILNVIFDVGLLPHLHCICHNHMTMVDGSVYEALG